MFCSPSISPDPLMTKLLYMSGKQVNPIQTFSQEFIWATRFMLSAHAKFAQVQYLYLEIRITKSAETIPRNMS